MTDDLLARGAAESRKRATVLRQLAARHRDDSLLAPAATADAEAELLDAVGVWQRAADPDDQPTDDYGEALENYATAAAELRTAAETLARLLVKED